METKLGTPHEQFAALCLLAYIEGLFTEAQKETFDRVELLVLFNSIKNDPELFDEDVLLAHDHFDAMVREAMDGETEEAGD